MHPEISLVLLTVLAGAGQGVFILLVALDSIFLNTGGLSSEIYYAGVIISLIFQLVGVIASTSHLGNPHRGWRAMLMFRNSWLSREVITLSLSMGLAVLYIFLYWKGAPASLRITAGAIGVLANIGFYISSSLVYGSVKFIREWSNGFTPANFLLFGITSGFAVGLAILHYAHIDSSIIYVINRMLLVMGSVCLLMKLLAYRFNDKTYISVNIKNAVGINDPDIKLVDSGTAYDHYNTTEYSFPITRQRNKLEKSVVIIVAFIVPLVIWGIMTYDIAHPAGNFLSATAAIVMIIGLIIERRLFFIHGNNLQNLYYSNFKTASTKNPLLSKAKKGTPVPTT
jgi:DMSO reductase anchor subunit